MAVAEKKDALIRVQATRMGFWEMSRVRPGEVITIKESQFSKNWMKKLGAAAAPKSRKPVVEEVVEEEALEESEEETPTPSGAAEVI